MRSDVQRAREAYGQRAWGDAFAQLVAADSEAALGPEDLELLASAAYLVGREDDASLAFERAHQAYLGENPKQRTRAARCAFWLGLFSMFQGEAGRASGWLARAQRLVEVEASDCVERGYLLLASAEQQLGAKNAEGARVAATEAVQIGERFGDVDLIACGHHLQGRALLMTGQLELGLALLDEAMLAATAGELSAVLMGLIYCSVIDACLQVYAFARAREWTAALGRWCAEQPQLVAFAGTCAVHRAQILNMNGDWHSAIAEVRAVRDRFSRGGQRPPGGAFYEEGEVQRVRGELDAAEEAYRNASLMGYEPQPGLALLRLAQGRGDTALAAMRRVVSLASDELARSKVLPAYVDVLLAAGDKAAARAACDELAVISEKFRSDALSAVSALSRASVTLAEGDAAAAVNAAKSAWEMWERIEAPHRAARARELLALAYRALGDDDGSTLQLEAARAVFEELGALPDVARVDALLRRPGVVGNDARLACGLSERELQVLRHVAAGKTNRSIARELFVSEKTIERHLSNIFNKLHVPSRAAATAYAYEHKLV